MGVKIKLTDEQTQFLESNTMYNINEDKYYHIPCWYKKIDVNIYEVVGELDPVKSTLEKYNNGRENMC